MRRTERCFASRASTRSSGLTDPSQTVAALLSGEADFIATHVGNAALLKSRDAPIKVVAAGATYDPKKPNSSLVAAPGQEDQAPATSWARRSPSTVLI